MSEDISLRPMSDRKKDRPLNEKPAEAVQDVRPFNLDFKSCPPGTTPEQDSKRMNREISYKEGCKIYNRFNIIAHFIIFLIY